MSSIKKNSTRRSDDTMDDDSDDKDSKRKSRNLSEKKRRDQFNLLVNELSSMVSTGSRKMDKSTVLKSTISFLKHHNEVTVKSKANEIQEDWKPTFLTNEEFTHLVLEAVDGFIMVFSASGQIFYVSESITSLLGHLPNELLNMTIYEMASDDEHNNLYNILLTPSEDIGQVSFSCHLRRGGSNTKQESFYEVVHFVGYFRSDDDMVHDDSKYSGYSGEADTSKERATLRSRQKLKRLSNTSVLWMKLAMARANTPSGSDDDMVHDDSKYSGYSGEADTRLVFVGTGRIQTPQLLCEMPLVDSSKSEFTSRHSLEWKFLFLDHRAPPIIGYLPFELLGTSGYDYYHIDDLDDVVSCHEALIQKGEGTSCYYRFLTKGQQWIWLQTRFYITYHQWNSKPEFIVCTHRVINYIDVMNRGRKVAGESSVVGSKSGQSYWSINKNSHSSLRQGPSSECTSMSADSPTSRQSALTQQSNQCQQQCHQQSVHPRPQQPHQQSQPFLESPQYVTAIPIQPMISSFSTSTFLSSLQPIDNVIMAPVQSQIQIDLQRKHAELQEIIGQQQAELRRVSEQLLMARLGLLSQQQENSQNISNASVSFPNCTSIGTVSSTTTTVQGPPANSGSSSILVSIPILHTSQQPQHHQGNVMGYNSPDSNGHNK